MRRHGLFQSRSGIPITLPENPVIDRRRTGRVTAFTRNTDRLQRGIVIDITPERWLASSGIRTFTQEPTLRQGGERNSTVLVVGPTSKPSAFHHCGEFI
jgi:hypothetical protein